MTNTILRRSINYATSIYFNVTEIENTV